MLTVAEKPTKSVTVEKVEAQGFGFPYIYARAY